MIAALGLTRSRALLGLLVIPQMIWGEHLHPAAAEQPGNRRKIWMSPVSTLPRSKSWYMVCLYHCPPPNLIIDGGTLYQAKFTGNLKVSMRTCNPNFRQFLMSCVLTRDKDNETVGNGVTGFFSYCIRNSESAVLPDLSDSQAQRNPIEASRTC